MTTLETRRTNLRRVFCAAVPLLLSIGVSAHAAPVTFNFNSLLAGAPSTGANSIQAYMQSVLNSTYGNGVVTVAVTGAVADSGAVQTAGGLSWTGDKHTVGGNSGTPTSVTLGNSNSCTGNGCTAGSADAYIRNDSLPINGTKYDVITMTFTGMSFNQASFDWEIFPDGTCTALDANTHSTNNCGSYHTTLNPNLPDFEFIAGANNPFTAFGVVPGTGGTYSRSPLGAETAPQAIGTGSWAFASTSTFQFIDWPATIGLDNLTLTPVPNLPLTPVPEPSSVALLVATLVGCYFLRRKRQEA